MGMTSNKTVDFRILRFKYCITIKCLGHDERKTTLNVLFTLGSSINKVHSFKVKTCPASATHLYKHISIYNTGAKSVEEVCNCHMITFKSCTNKTNEYMRSVIAAYSKK